MQKLNTLVKFQIIYGLIRPLPYKNNVVNIAEKKLRKSLTKIMRNQPKLWADANSLKDSLYTNAWNKHFKENPGKTIAVGPLVDTIYSSIPEDSSLKNKILGSKFVEKLSISFCFSESKKSIEDTREIEIESTKFATSIVELLDGVKKPNQSLKSLFQQKQNEAILEGYDPNQYLKTD